MYNVYRFSFFCKSYPQVLNKNGMVEFSVTSNETITVSPEYVGSRLLLKLKEMAEKYLGMPVANAVISVPAEFDLKQRNSTIEAANLAGNSHLSLSYIFLKMFLG